MTMKNNLKPIINSVVQQKVDEGALEELEQAYEKWGNELKVTRNDKKTYLFHLVFTDIRTRNKMSKIEKLLKEQDTLGIAAKLLEQTRYIISLEESMLQTLYTEEDLVIATADFTGQIDLKSTELADLVIEAIEEILEKSK